MSFSGVCPGVGSGIVLVISLGAGPGICLGVGLGFPVNCPRTGPGGQFLISAYGLAQGEAQGWPGGWPGSCSKGHPGD